MEKYDVNQPVQLKKGVYKLNAERNFDYQLNRVINWDGGRIEDIRPVAGKIKTSSDWKRELIALGDKAMEESRTQNAINMLKNVKSLTFRLFTDKEDAQNHCNVGNGKIVLDTICNWIQSIDAEAMER